MALREPIRQALIGNGSQPWSNRVAERRAMTPQTDTATGLAPAELPFLVLVGLSEDPSASLATLLSWEVWPHVEESTFDALDTLAQQVKTQLVGAQEGGQVIVDPADGSGWLVGYAGSPLLESPVRSWDAYTRPMRFRSLRLAALTPTDSRLASLVAWTADTWPGAIQAAPFTITDNAPLIFWERGSGPLTDEDESTLWGARQVETIIGHVVAPTPTGRATWVDALALALRGANVLHLVPQGGYVATRVLRADVNADPLLEGQVTLEARYWATDPRYVQSSPLPRATLVDGSLAYQTNPDTLRVTVERDNP